MQLTDDFASDAIFDHSRAQRYRSKSFREMLINYYSNTEYYRTPQQIRRDEWIIPGRVRCRAWMVIPIAVISQFCLGSIYAWSLFNKPIDKHIFNDHEANFAHITFYIALGMLGLSGAIFGPWIESHSPRMCALLGAVVFFAGHCTAALGLACREIAMLYFGYGFIGGIGLGIGYVTTIDAVIKWYPSSRGFASGLAVCGFGSGSVAFSNLNTALLRTFTVPQAFAILGTINLVVMLVCALLMRPPHPDYNIPGVAMDMVDQSLTDINYHQHRTIQHTIKGRSANIGGQTITVASDSGDPVLVITLSQALSSPDFWLLWVAFFVNLIFGVVLISNLASMTTHMFGMDTPVPVTAIVTIDGLFNASGLLFSGWISDFFGRRRTFLLVISTQIVIVACLISIIPQLKFWSFIVLAWLATLCYGGGVGVIAATLADMFGAPNMSSCHGVMLTGWSVAAIGGGLIYTAIVNYMTGSLDYTVRDPSVYVVNEYWIISLLICGWFSLLFIRVTPRERLFPPVHGQIFRCTLAGFTFRLARGTEQHGLRDYEFLAATANSDSEKGSTASINSSSSIQNTDNVVITNVKNKRISGLDRLDIDLDSHNVYIDSSVESDTTSKANTNMTMSVGIRTDCEQPLGSERELASEAFNYVAHDQKSIFATDIGAEESCVQLVCATPPVRQCIVLFNKWRLELVSAEEMTTIWRMYLSCALLGAANNEI